MEDDKEGEEEKKTETDESIVDDDDDDAHGCSTAVGTGGSLGTSWQKLVIVCGAKKCHPTWTTLDKPPA